MQGLIRDQMPQQAMPEEQGAAMPQAMPEEQGEQMEDPNANPAYVEALRFAMQALYENGAAEGVAKSLRLASDPVEGMANTAYEIVSIVEDRTDGAVPDELLVLLATRILEEVADIAEAAGIEVRGSTVAMALKQMILRYLGEQGMDTTQLAQAMDQVDPSEFDRIAEEQGEESEEVPA